MNLKNMNIRDLFSFRSSKTDGALIFFGFFFIAAIILFYAYSFSFFLPPVLDNVLFIIPEGASASVVAETLFQKGVIRSQKSFLFYVKLINAEKTFRPGIFVFSGTYLMPDVINKLQRFPSARTVTLLEGWTTEQIGDYFEKEGFFLKSAFVEAATQYDGMLFPDTYELYVDVTPQEVVAALYQNFQQRTAHLQETIEKSGRNFSDIVIMGSLLEKESHDSADRRIISGILWKRLDNNHPLQVDATLTFLTKRNGLKLTTDDLAIDSPYNTYKYAGLPAGPIGNPGLDAIEAAAFPEESPYWYYLHDPTGGVHYAATIEEHNANVAAYLR